MNPTDNIFKAINKITGFSTKQIQSKSRKEHLVYARRIICFHLLNHGYKERHVANIINRHYTTVFNIKRTHSDEYRFNPKFRKLFDSVYSIINNNSG